MSPNVATSHATMSRRGESVIDAVDKYSFGALAFRLHEWAESHPRAESFGIAMEESVMAGQEAIADGLNLLEAQLSRAAEGDTSLSEPSRAALLDLTAVLKELRIKFREDPQALAHELMQLARTRPALVVEGARYLRDWSNQGERVPEASTEGASRGYVKSEAPGSAFLQSDLEDGGNLSAVSGSSTVVQGEDVDSKHIAPG